ncbi:LPXTG cell wall anchor domain-containing protein [Lactococcus formosensis]|uniref:LPXTG cell wall anchor domain-containing protein n=1 Tax=Lactococcus formosensis TaxID=1281486 RepID=UPI002434CB02|nr:LPXTG cell wall anchor domain-containing protein [Lactococcus formosensis]MDG6120829.1 LPXTG cell wall anchor domain-containing protein [Lactococcus formosensis]
MSNKRILIYLLGLLSVMFISLASVNNANAEESRVTITIKQNSNNQEGGNSGKEELDNQGSDNAKNEEASHQKENTTKKTKKKHILKLPETGEINSFEYIIFGIVILGISLLYIIKKRNRGIKDEKS